MKTQVIMKRELFGAEISQQSKSEFFSSTDLVRIGNKWRIANGLKDFNISAFLNNKKTNEFVTELESKYGKVIIKGRGKGKHTWVHPLLFIDIALAINPKLKVEVYEWLFDNLIKYRNDSGDSYREMSASLWSRYDNKRAFPKFISETASNIRSVIGVKDWETATQEQLAIRDKIHHSIKVLCNVLNNAEQSVRLGIKEYVEFSKQ